MKKLLALSLVLLILMSSLSMAAAQDDPIVVGSKTFIEQRVLGYLILVALQDAGFEVEDQVGLGDTAIARGALEAGEIDVYPNYTATAAIQSLPNLGLELPEGIANTYYECYAVVSSLDAAYNDLVWLQPAPANNTYAIAATRAWAEENGIFTLEELAAYANDGGTLKMISNDEFTSREDGLPTFLETYGFEIDEIESLPGSATSPSQQQLASGEGGFNLSVAYGTDGTLAALDLVVLADTLGAQPVYQPTPVFRGEVIRAHPEIAGILNPIFATLDEATLQELNSRVALGENAEDVARDYLQSNGFID